LISKNNNQQGGFTLVEFLIAIIILAVAILAMVGLQSTAMRSNASSKWQTAATTIAEQQLVQLKNTGYANLSNTSWTTAQNITLTGLGTFSVQYQVTDSVANYLKYIQVQVTWTDKLGISKQINLSTYLAKSG
jgi:type IV pilus assembly protein PilV